jgi:hypothetical protein
MANPPLKIDHLLAAGFVAGGEWQLVDLKISCGRDMPKASGVYAFSVDGIVMYVGLASRSLARRLAFYRQPGATQSTNIRLNDIISKMLASHRVMIHVAHPPTFSWNGLPVLGAQGLEAGLIDAFDLPWNKKGGGVTELVTGPPTRSRRLTQMGGGASLLQNIETVIRSNPGLTEAEIAAALFGKAGYQQKVNPICRQLVKDGRICRVGIGGARNPFTYRAV